MNEIISPGKGMRRMPGHFGSGVTDFVLGKLIEIDRKISSRNPILPVVGLGKKSSFPTGKETFS